MKKATKATSLIAICLVGGAALLSSRQSRAQDTAQMPSPASLMRSLDLACHKVTEAEPPVSSLALKHLNPVLQGMGIVEERAQLQALEQLCVPVAKNGVMPPPDVLPFIRYFDLACYHATSTVSHPPIGVNLSQLNPVLRRAGVPDHQVIFRDLQQLCVPVAKRGAEPPASILRLIQHVDVACYKIGLPLEVPKVSLRLADLNPLFSTSPQAVRTQLPEQLCVPVAKSVPIPAEIARIVQWIDFEKFALTTPIAPLPRTLWLRHLNPQFANSAAFQIRMLGITHLDAPVAKNGHLPPTVLQAEVQQRQ